MLTHFHFSQINSFFKFFTDASFELKELSVRVQDCKTSIHETFKWNSVYGTVVWLAGYYMRWKVWRHQVETSFKGFASLEKKESKLLMRQLYYYSGLVLLEGLKKALATVLCVTSTLWFYPGVCFGQNEISLSLSLSLSLRYSHFDTYLCILFALLLLLESNKRSPLAHNIESIHFISVPILCFHVPTK